MKLSCETRRFACLTSKSFEKKTKKKKKTRRRIENYKTIREYERKSRQERGDKISQDLKYIYK